MSRLRLLREAHLQTLRANIAANAERYEADETWLPDYFRGSEWSLPSTVEVPDGLTLIPPTDDAALHDVENTKILYSALRHLTPMQAADERLWAHLTHVTFWKYMRARWATEKYRANPRFAEIVLERYFFMSDRPRSLVRNGIARLWWYGYATYDSTREDPFELTAVLLKNLDVAQSILERNFSRNRDVAHAVLNVMRQLEQGGTPFYERDKVRDLAKFLVQLGGVTIIDALDRADIEQIVAAKAGELAEPRMAAAQA